MQKTGKQPSSKNEKSSMPKKKIVTALLKVTGLTAWSFTGPCSPSLEPEREDEFEENS